jgi:hypothetical protein
MFLLYDASGKGRGDFSSDFSNDFAKYQWTVILLQTGAGIYALVRGLDNLKQGYERAKELQKKQV